MHSDLSVRNFVGLMSIMGIHGNSLSRRGKREQYIPSEIGV